MSASGQVAPGPVHFLALMSGDPSQEEAPVSKLLLSGGGPPGSADREWHRAYRLYGDRLLKQLVRSGLQHDDGREVAQRVWIAALRKVSTWSGDSAFSAWLAGIARNEVLQFRRDEARRVDREVDDAGLALTPASVEDALEVLLRKEQLAAIVNHLPSDLDRELLKELHDSSLSREQIAAKFGLKEKSLTQRLRRIGAQTQAIARQLGFDTDEGGGYGET